MSGFRDPLEQARLYRKGRTYSQISDGKNKLIKLGRRDLANLIDIAGKQQGLNILTNALPGQSIHEYGYAIDFAPFNDDGTVEWDDESKYETCAKVFKRYGFDCGFYWVSFHDNPHIQITEGLKWRDLIKGERPSFDK